MTAEDGDKLCECVVCVSVETEIVIYCCIWSYTYVVFYTYIVIVLYT